MPKGTSVPHLVPASRPAWSSDESLGSPPGSPLRPSPSPVPHLRPGAGAPSTQMHRTAHTASQTTMH